MAPLKAKLPVIPLAKDTILLPGIVLRIPVPSDRPDIPALLSSVYSRAASKTPSQRLDNVNVVCVPLTSPLLSRNGQKTISQNEHGPEPSERPDINPSNASKNDLFGYGVAAKISGVEGRGTGEFALLVEGMARVKVDKITQEAPFFEAEVTYKHDEGKKIFPLMTSHMLIQFKLYHLKTSQSRDCLHTSSSCLATFSSLPYYHAQASRRCLRY
jgi:ATP-dependent Lon protease